MPKGSKIFSIIAIVLALFGASETARADRLKDLASVAGVRANQLVGYVIVVGLSGTGDGNTQLTLQTIQSMVAQFGQSTDLAGIKGKNAAAVMVTGDLPPFMKPGQTMDVTVSTLGEAKSLRGGTLLMTPLLGADGQTYAIAQGNLLVGGLGVEGGDGSNVIVNVPTVGRIPRGASVERMVDTSFLNNPYLVLNLNQGDFSTAYRVSEAINAFLDDTSIATPIDGTSVRVKAPEEPSQKVAFMSLIENIEVDPARPSAKVVVNSRTGTIVIGGDVRVTPAAVSHGSLTVRIDEDKKVTPTTTAVVNDNQAVVAPGEPVVEDDTDIMIDQPDAQAFVFDPGVDLSSIVDTMNGVGATPADLVPIF